MVAQAAPTVQKWVPSRATPMSALMMATFFTQQLAVDQK
jgi:hypothetical protein